MIKEFNSYIFKPDEILESIEERKNLISWIILLLAILFLVLELVIPASIILTSIFLINIWFLLTQTNKYPRLNGSFPIKISITPEKIVIGKNEFATNKIQIDRIVCFDYRGRKRLEYYLFMKYMSKSNGIYNHIWFNHENTKYKFRFRVDSKKHMEVLEEIKRELIIK